MVGAQFEVIIDQYITSTLKVVGLHFILHIRFRG